MSQLFRDMPFVVVYIDNICFASSTWKEHAEHLRAVLSRLNTVNMRVKPTSINVGNYQIKLLGHVVTPLGIGIDPDKKQMILNWRYPTTGAAMQSFLGLGTYLRDHVRHYADLTAPLERIKTRKVIEWTDALRHAFDTVKRAFATAPFLVFPSPNKRFVVACDASQSGIGGMLYQPDDEDNTVTADNIVAVYSRQLKPHEQRYPIYKKELLGMVMCLRKFHTYIHCNRNVTVLTDHKPLIHIMNQAQLSLALQQWLDVILNYDIQIKYRPGVLHIIPDALSRMYMSVYGEGGAVWGSVDNVRVLDAFDKYKSPSDVLCAESIRVATGPSTIRPRHRIDPPPRTGEGKGDGSGRPASHDNNNTIHLMNTNNNNDNYYYCSSSITHDAVRVDWDVCDTLDDMRDSETACTYAPLYALSAPPPPQLQRRQLLTVEEQLLIAQQKRDRIIPTTDEEKKRLVQSAHDLGHFGRDAMFANLDRRRYWWPSIITDINREIASCIDCQRFVVRQHGFAPAQSITTTRPGEHYQIDLMSMPRSLDGHKYCFVLVDVFTGFVMLEPLKDKEMNTIARALWHVCSVIGLPRILQSDNGSEFVNKVLSTFCRLFGITRRYIAPYNPRVDGKVERSIRVVKETIMKMMRGTTVLWHLYIPFVQYAYNNKVRVLTGTSPFVLMYARTPNEPCDYTETTIREKYDWEEWKRHQEKVVSLILPAVRERVLSKQHAVRLKLDKLRKSLVRDELLPGTLVLIKDPQYLLNPSLRPSSQPPYIGPYTVVKRTLHGPYLLRDDTGSMYTRQVPVDQLKIIHTPQADDAVDQQDGYEVDYIIEHEETDSGMMYKIKWKGYDVKEATWEPEEHINDIATVERYFRLLMLKQQTVSDDAGSKQSKQKSKRSQKR
jgi:transposase InsO family protein